MGGVPFIYWEGEQIIAYKWAREESSFYIRAETGEGRKRLSFCSATGKMLLGWSADLVSVHRPPRWQLAGAGGGAGLEDERGVAHGHQPLRCAARTADPVLVHGGDDAQHVPTPEAQLARFCSAVVAERADGPVASRGTVLGGSEAGHPAVPGPPLRRADCPLGSAQGTLGWLPPRRCQPGPRPS